MNNWQTKKLGELCDILDNQRKPVTQRDRISGKYPYYGATGIKDYVNEYIFDEKLILIGEDGAKWGVGENTAFTAEGKYWVNNHAHVIRPHRNIILDNWIVFFFYLTDLTKYTTGLTVPKLNQANLRNISIPLPPLVEQQRIVKILDKVFGEMAKAKENTEKNLQNAKELFESYLQNVLINKSWKVKKLNEISENLDSKRIPITKKLRNLGKYPYYGASGIVDNVDKYIFDGNLLLVSEDGANLLARTYPIAFSITGKTWVNNHAHVLKFEIKESQKFAEYYLNSIKLDPFVSGMAQPKLNQKMLNSIPIPFPSLFEQKDIVKKLDNLAEKTKRLEEIYRQKIADLEELKKSILNKAFRGEL